MIGFQVRDTGATILRIGGNGLYLYGAYSLDGDEFSVYVGSYLDSIKSPGVGVLRLDTRDKCTLVTNEIGTISVSNPSEGKTYKYYALKIGVI